jgi:hypothetical protein
MIDSGGWIKAKASNDSGSCVQMRGGADLVEVRDSKNGVSGPILRISRTGFSDWLRQAKAGRLDHLSSPGS